ncbi:MAG: 1-acyl-sn-glycerol-3-phosphate acyltransferase [Spirochaetales bacterium]|nr:1-acyl-sn-glycerol-3-phosphate acyltransferase [Spirochaetales bacterium]
MGDLSKRPLFVRLAAPTWGRWVLRRNRVTGRGLEKLTAIDGPFLVLCNHSHTLDPFFISALSPVHIRWVAGAYLFKLPFLRLLLHNLVGAISKQQGRSDMHMMRQITAAFKKGDVVGIFPEGTRTWDGEPMSFDSSLAKLIKFFKVPVVILNFEGLYAIKPRWTDHRRKGNAVLAFKSLLTVEEAKVMSIEELYEHLKKELGFSYRRWQRRVKARFIGKRSAEGIEKALYLCPSCMGGSTIIGKRRTVSCTACDLSYTLNEHERLENDAGGKALFEDIAAWRDWQRSYLNAHHPAFPDDEGVLFQTGDETRLRTITTGFSLRLEEDGMTLTTATQTYRFDFDRITSMIINAKNTLEFYCNGFLYRVRIAKHRSVLKYVELHQSHMAEEVAP